jgi:glyoxylase-like metal-dependent hydrolase (beta-lactamase superfamily II)
LGDDGRGVRVGNDSRASRPKWLISKPQDRYVEITLHDNVMISFAESRSLLERIGIAGEILPTPGHSDDSVSLLLDDGAAFTGDLTPLPLAGNENADVVAASWRRLEEHGAARVYRGHGPVRSAANGLRVGSTAASASEGADPPDR